ncbi:hypothetical protein NQ317_009048, partial [Molorchus minor]
MVVVFHLDTSPVEVSCHGCGFQIMFGRQDVTILPPWLDSICLCFPSSHWGVKSIIGCSEIVGQPPQFSLGMCLCLDGSASPP